MPVNFSEAAFDLVADHGGTDTPGNYDCSLSGKFFKPQDFSSVFVLRLKQPYAQKGTMEGSSPLTHFGMLIPGTETRGTRQRESG